MCSDFDHSVASVLRFFSNTSTIPSSQFNDTAQSTRGSAVSLLYLTDRICLLWACVSSCVSASVTFTLIASQQITFICTVTPVKFPCYASHYNIFSFCIFLPQAPTVQFIATCHRVIKSVLHLWLLLWDYFTSSKCFIITKGIKSSTLRYETKPSCQNVFPLKEYVTTWLLCCHFVEPLFCALGIIDDNILY